MSDSMPAGKGNMRDKMPSVAEWVDSLREVFGAEKINPMLSRIHACENGHTIGRPAQHNVVGQPIGYAVAVSAMPDIVSLLQDRQKAQNDLKAVGKRKR